MFNRIKEFLSPAKPSPEATKVKYPESEKEFKTEITEIDAKNAEKILKQVKIKGDDYQGQFLNIEMIKKNKLEPKYKIRLQDITILFSSQAYEIGKGRIAVMAYVKKGDEVIARSYYRSNSQGVWRFLPDYKVDENDEIEWYGKGLHEQSIALPIVLQKALVEISEKGARKVDNPNLLLLGTARKFDFKQSLQRVSYYQEVGLNRNNLEGSFYDKATRKKISPERIDFKNPADKPDFTKINLAFNLPTKLYGQISVEVYSSKNGNYQFMFCRDQKNRVWIGSVEDAKSDIKSTGLKKDWIYAGDLTTPAYEYGGQAGHYANIKDMNGAYVDMFKNYLSKIPIIQEYCQKNNIFRAETSAQEKNIKIEDAQNFEELAKAVQKLGGLQGTKDYFPADEISGIIYKIRAGQSKLENLPRAGGLRDKVEELMAKEPDKISQIQNFEDLFFLLDRLGGLRGTQGIYKSDDLKKIIVQYLQGKVKADHITRAEGLRDKVEELAKKKAA